MIIGPEECLSRAEQCARLAEMGDIPVDIYSHFKEREAHYMRLAKLLQRRQLYLDKLEKP